MSLRIDVDKVKAIMLVGTSEWIVVLEQTFNLDAYEYMHEGACVLAGGQVAGVASTGFMCKTHDGWLAGPVTSIAAVKLNRE